MDVWIQVYAGTYWNDQIDRSISALNAACPKRQAVFFMFRSMKGEAQMSRFLRDQRNRILYLSWKKNQIETEIKTKKISA